nr:unnamed protein product [Callosobruchus analis]
MMVSNNCDFIDSGTYNADLSDHQLVYCKIGKFVRNTEPKMVTVRDFKNFDFDRFQYNLVRIPFFGIYDTVDIDRKVHILEDNPVKLFNIHAPQIVVRCTKPVAPWFTNVIKVMIKIRDNALRKFKKDRNIAKWEFYKVMRNNVNKAVEREKKAYMEFKLRNGNYRERLRILKSNNIIPDKKSKLSIPEHLHNVDKINEYFTKSLPTLAPADHLLENYDTNTVFPDLFSFEPVEDHLIFSILKEIKSKSTGNDGLNIMMVELCFSRILPFLKHIINFCLSNSVYPSSWKKVIVVPLPKKSNIEEYKDLRAISILPVLFKFLEKTVAMKLREHLEVKTVLPEIQSGFRSGHSCSTALLKRDAGEYTVLILLDFSRAFDTLNHYLLLKILNFIGMARSTVTFFSNYLKDRQHRVVLNGESSVFMNITAGVP